MTEPAITVENIGKRYRLGERESYRAMRDTIQRGLTAPVRVLRRSERKERREVDHIWALRGVSFEIQPGEVVGVIGRNGAGKSTLLKILSKITEPTEGDGVIRGSVGSLLEVGTGFHPELTGRENVYLNGAILGMTRAEIDRKFDDIIEFAGVPQFVDTPVKRFSTGMQVRLAFAVAAHLEPDIILVDEVLAVGDAEFQKRCMGKMETVGSEGRTVLFVSHSMPAILRLCPRVILLDTGGVIADGPAQDVIRTYLDTGLGTMAGREWASPDQAPGGDHFRLKAVRVRNQDGEVSEAIDIHRPIDIEIEFWKMSPAPVVAYASLAIWNEDGVLLFVTTDAVNSDPTPLDGAGIARRVCRIPANLLAESQLFVHVEIGSSEIPVRDVRESDVVAFRVVDQSGGEGARGQVTRHWPGVVRPILPWTADFEPTRAKLGSPG